VKQPYDITPPSLLNAPLDVVIGGTPPDMFPDLPTGGDVDTVVALVAMESSFNSNKWVWMGSDAGLGTISGTILANGYWVGDVIRVRIRSFNVVALSDPTKNWEGIYSVTLQAVDPFWDIAYGIPFATYASLILVNATAPGQMDYYVPPTIPVPNTARGHVYGHNRPASGNRAAAAAAKRASRKRNLMSPPSGSDWQSLPSVADYYLAQRANNDINVRNEYLRSKERRSQREPQHQSLYAHPGKAPAPIASHHAPAHPQQQQRQQPKAHERPSHARRIASHRVKGHRSN